MAHPRTDFTSRAFLEAPGVRFAELRARGPVVPLRLPFLGDVWATTDYATARAMLKDAGLFSRDHAAAGLPASATFKWWMPGFFRPLMENMLTRDGAEHRRLRSLVETAFARRGIEAMRAEVAETAHALLDRIDPAGPVDIVAAYTRLLPLLVICRMLGLPPGEVPQVARWMAGLTTASSIMGLFAAFSGSRKGMRYFRERIERARSDGAPGLIGDLVAAEADGDRLSADELLAMVFTIFIAGHETTVHLLSGSVLALHDEPRQKARLLADPAAVPRAVEELMRFITPVQFTKPRFVTRDTDVLGIPLQRGSQVTALLGAANRDPARFEAPDSLDLGRIHNPHLGFGTGEHVCLGMQLARIEAQEGLSALYGRFPDLTLAVPRDRVAWRKRIGMRALNRLPVRLAG